MGSRTNRRGGLLGALVMAIGTAACAVVLVLFAALDGASGGAAAGLVCGASLTVGATEYGGPGDPSSGIVGASGVSLLAQPDSFAELGGTSFDTATALGGLPYGTPLQITVGRRSVIAYKQDIGLGGGPIDGHPRSIDLWWQLASSLGIPYERGRWSGLVRIASVSAGCDGADAAVGGQSAGAGPDVGAGASSDPPLSPGRRATLLGDGLAAAPLSAPAAVKEIIAAGNQIVGKPYVYGGAHGLPLDLIAPYYDCSSSVAHLLYGGGLLPVDADLTSTDFESWGLPGPGRWVTIYASGDHVFMYVAGMRWDTHAAAGPGDGSAGIGWHPLVRTSAGFVVRHPPGL